MKKGYDVYDYPVISFWYYDIQALSKKYFGDNLTGEELEELDRICSPEDWSRVDDGGYEGALGQLITAVVSIIGLVRTDRRGK